MTGSHLPTLSALLPVLPVTNDPHFLEKVTLDTMSAKGNETRCNFDVKVSQSPGVGGVGTAIWKGPRAPLSQKKTYQQKPTQYNVKECAGSLEILCWFWRWKKGTMNQGMQDASRNWKWQGFESPSFRYSKKNSALRTLSLAWPIFYFLSPSLWDNTDCMLLNYYICGH